MKTKNLLFNCSLAIAISATTTGNLNAQIVGTDAFMKGNYVEIGIKGTGGYEGATAAAPSGMHARGGIGLFGFVANPQMDSWTNYDGDFYTPGTPENGWGIEIGTTGGIKRCNNASGSGALSAISGSITGWSHVGTVTSTNWEGNDVAAGLNVKINYSLGDNALFYLTTVSVTNTSSVTLNDIFYYRNLDPDNNQSLTGVFATTNSVVSQHSACSTCYAQISATQTTPWLSYVGFVTTDTAYVAGYGGFTNRDGSDMYNGVGYTQTVGSSLTADGSIYLAYKIPALTATSARVFRFATVFAPTAVASAVTALSPLSTSLNETKSSSVNVSVYPNPIIDNGTISIDNSIVLSNASVVIYDMFAKKMRVIEMQSNTVSFEKGDLAAGMYFYKLVNKGSEVVTGKLIVK